MISSDISFLGDISLNDRYNKLYKEGVKPFAEVVKILSKSDLVIGNLECLAEGSFGENLLKKPRLKTNLKTLNYLKDINLGLALLAHNHVYDNLEDGFKKTVSFLDNNNIAHIGAGLTSQEAEKPFIKKIDGVNICILNYVTHDTNPRLPDDATVYLNWFKEKKVIADIKKFRRTCDKVILCLHWGGNCEGGYYPDWEQPFIARRLIDAGADLIMGGHSHTLQPYEIYDGKYIFYSLGNFCFSDIHSDGKIDEVKCIKETESIIANISFLKSSCNVNLIPIENKKLFIKINLSILNKLNKCRNKFKIINNVKTIWNLYYIKYKYFDPVIFYFWGNNHKFFNKLSEIRIKKIIRYFRR